MLTSATKICKADVDIHNGKKNETNVDICNGKKKGNGCRHPQLKFAKRMSTSDMVKNKK